MYKNNSGFSAKFKASIFVQSSVIIPIAIGRKVNALKSATIHTPNVRLCIDPS